MTATLARFAETLRRLTIGRHPGRLPADLAAPADPMLHHGEAPLDVLSEVLRVVRLSGAIHFLGEFTQPWAFASSPPAMFAARLKVTEGSVTPFHVCVEGGCWVIVGTLAPIWIEAGDVVIFPRGDQHVMTSDPALAPVPINQIYARPSPEQITVMRYGGDGRQTRFICGFLHADLQFDPLLRSLPALLAVRACDGVLTLETLDESGRTARPIERRQEVEWWQASLRYLIGETAVPGPGNRAVLARLAESLFVEVLRWQLRHAAEGHGGWLAGLHDPQIGRILSLLHALPDRPWTVDGLAAEANMSRAAFAKRFVELVGQSPIQYLAGWRMHLARDLLRDTRLCMGEIAERVGYESEAAFNRAFRRLVGSPPATWRQARQAAAAPLPLRSGADDRAGMTARPARGTAAEGALRRAR